MDYGIRLKRPAKKRVLQIADLFIYKLHALKNCVIIPWTHLQCWNGRNAEVLIKFFTREKKESIYNIPHTDGSSMFQQQHPLFSKLLQAGADQ
jgi:hypothetical protein